ncbi:MAG: hypothetical protein ACKOWH_00170 [Rhodoluna sp.]
MTDLPLPVLIGGAMIVVGIALGVWIAVQAISSQRKNKPLD